MMRKIMKPKRGAIGIIIFFSILIIILIMGFIGTIVWAVMDIASDEITPIMLELGMAGDVNMSQASEYTFGVTNTFVQAMPWLIAVAYILALVFTLVFVFIVGYTPHPAFIPFYLALMVLLIFACVIMSNMYQDIYTGTDDLALRLKEQSTTSYMILHSPYIMTFIAIFGGILMFARSSASEDGMTGGFGI